MPRRTAIVAGLVRDGLGLGEAARGHADALARAGWDVRQYAVVLPFRPEEPVGDPGPDGLSALPFATADDDADVLILCLNPPEVRVVIEAELPMPSARFHIGVWAWEVEPAPPDWADIGARFHEIWVGSAFVADVVGDVARRAGVPLAIVPPAVRPMPGDGPAPSGDGVFLTVADAASTLERKNPGGAIDAFCSAFAPGEGPTLVVKVWGGGFDPEGIAQLHDRAVPGGRTDVVVVDRWMPRSEFARLLTSAACLVALHRSEGFGLPIFEAMAAGIPVIASASGGPLDLLEDTNAFLVPTTPTLVPAGIRGYPAGSRWAEPSLPDAVTRMREVWDDLDGARLRAATGRSKVRAIASLEAVGRRMDERLTALCEGGPRQVQRRLVSTPNVSVIVHAVEPWPALATFLAALLPQVDEVAGEIVVGVADETVLPLRDLSPRIRRVVVGSKSPFQLRAAALPAASADLLVMLEDHSWPRPGWLAAYWSEYLRSAPALMTGPVGNGSPNSNSDWANYLVNFAAVAPPMDGNPSNSRCPTIANCAVARRVYEGGLPLGAAPEPEWFERQLVRHLHQTGQTVVVPDAVVDHHQSFPWWRHLLHHVHDSRCAGAHTAAVWPEAVIPLEVRAVLDSARELLKDVTASVASRPDLHHVHRRAALHLRLLAISRSAAQAAGARWGAGRSATRVD